MTDDKPPMDANHARLDALLDETLADLDTVEPPAGFADRVLAAHAADALGLERDDEVRPAPPAPADVIPFPRRIAPMLAAAAAAAVLVLGVTTGPARLPASGALTATTTDEVAIGGRAVAVAEVGATLSWDVALGGSAVVRQDEGKVFYRVNEGGPFVVETPAGNVTVHGTCFTVEVPMSVVTSPASKLTSHVAAAAVGAVLAAGVLVTVSEGSVAVASSEGETQLVAGEAAELKPGFAPRKTKGAAADEARTAALKEERDRLKRQVGELDDQLKVYMMAEANGTDPQVARARALEQELQAVKAELAVEKELRENKEGDRIEWPEDISDEYRGEALKARLLEALAASGLEGDLDSIDCTEYPCVLYGEVTAPDDKTMSDRFRAFINGMHGHYPEKQNSYSVSSWGGTKNVDGKEVQNNKFGVSIYPSASTDDAEAKKALSRRLRHRYDQYREAAFPED